MPKRSNVFQNLILVLTQMFGDNAKVTESKELIDLVSGEKREVDVVVETSVAGHDTIISIECRDHQRKQTVEWVEQAQAKHERLPTNLLVLVSSSGFTAKALVKAKSYGIKAITPGQVTPHFVGQIVNAKAKFLVRGLRLTSTERRLIFTTDPSIAPSTPPVISDGLELCLADGTAVTTAGKYDKALMDRFNKEHADIDSFEGQSFEICEEPPTHEGQPLHARYRFAEETVLLPISKYELSGTASVEFQELELTQGEYDSIYYALADARVVDHDVHFVFAEKDGGTPPRIAVKATPVASTETGPEG